MRRLQAGLLAAASLIAAASPGAALAQSAQGAGGAAPSADAGSAVQEVVVTARQRSERLQNVPASVSVLTSAAIAAAGVARADNIVALTPGVSLVAGAAEQGDIQVNIRGVNSARDADPSFAFVVDGIQIANPASFNREFTDLQQIEVVKGPQGAIYGRNAEAGAIIVTTKKPGDRLEGLVDGSAASYGSYTGKAYFAGPLGPKVSGSISADYRRTDGQYRNMLYTDQANLDSFEGGDIAGRLYIHLDDTTDLDLKARYGKLEAGSIDYNAAFELPAFAAALGNPLFYEDVNKHNYIFENNVENKNSQETKEFSAKIEHDFGWGRLTAWGLYSEIDNNLIADGTGASFGFFNTAPSCIASTAALTARGVQPPSPQFFTGVPATSLFGPYTATACDGYQYQVRDQKDESFEIRIASPSNQRLRWMAGGYYLHVDRHVGVGTGIDSDTGQPPHQLYVPAGRPYSTEQLLDDAFTSNVGAVFGQAQYDILPNVEGSVALRYDQEDRKDHNLVPTDARTTYIDFDGPPYTGGAPLNPGLDPALNPGGIRDQSKSYSQLQPKFDLRWTVNPSLSVYADYGVGFKSGGFNNAGSATTIDVFINGLVRVPAGFDPVNIQDTYKKEVSHEGEVGGKGRLFDGRLTYDVAGFYNKVDNMQFFEFYVGPFGLLRVVSNIDKVTLYGGELGLQYRASRELTVGASGAYTHSNIDKNAVRPDTVGNKSPYTPDYTWNLFGQYDRPVMTDSVLHARLDVRGTGPTWFHVVQNQPNPTLFELTYGALGRADFSKTERDAFTTVDLRLGVEHRGVTLTAFGTNVFNERYPAEVIPAPEFGGAFTSPAPGARYGVEMTYKF